MKKKLLLAVSILGVIGLAFVGQLVLGLLLAALCASLYLLNKETKVIIYKGTGDWQSEHRNLDHLLFGSTTVWLYIKNLNVDRMNLLSFALHKRSLFADFLNLKHKFSYLKETGQALITIDCLNPGECCSEKKRFFDILTLHRITLKNLDVNMSAFKNASTFPLFYYPVQSLQLLLTYFSGFQRRNSKAKFNEQQRGYVVSTLSEMADFCFERAIIPKVIFVNFRQDREDVLGIKAKLASVHPQLTVVLLPDVKALKEQINDSVENNAIVYN